MIRLLLATILAVSALLVSCAAKQDTPLDITLYGKGCNNLMARLYRDTDSGLAIVDSARFEMQKARLKCHIQSPELMYIYIENATDYLPVFVDSANIDIEFNSAKPIRSIVSGSESNKIFTDFLQSYWVYVRKETGNMKMLQSAYCNNDTVMIERLNEGRILIRQETDGLQRQFIRKYIDHTIACYILSTHLMFNMRHSDLKQLADSIPESNRNNIYYRRILRHIEETDTTQPETIASPSIAEYANISHTLRLIDSPAERIVKAARMLSGRPYVSGTLDETDVETIVADLTRFDCVTFQETCLALAIDAGSAEPSFYNFRHTIEKIRYRNGKNTGYCSRLHYTTDWIADNVMRGNITDITKELGGVELTNDINFMSSHSNLYKHLKGNNDATDSIRTREQWLNSHHSFYIPKDQISAIAHKIPNGSLIFITTSTPGLDFAHVGIALNENGVVKMIHASSTEHKTTITSKPLAQYLEGVKKFTGIAVAVPR